MSNTTAPQITTRTATLLHRALLVGAFIIAVGLSVARSLSEVAPVAPVELLRYVTVGVFIIDVAIARWLRSRFPPSPPADREIAWWEENLSRAIVVWALAEGAVLFAAVIHFVSGDWLALALAGGGLYVLWRDRPARLLAR